MITKSQLKKILETGNLDGFSFQELQETTGRILGRGVYVHEFSSEGCDRLLREMGDNESPDPFAEVEPDIIIEIKHDNP